MSEFKVIFLDIDGVLVTNESMSQSGVGPHAKAAIACVVALNEITRRTEAKIVITSSWRIYGMKFVENKFREWGVEGEVIGETPKISKHSDFYISAGRALEIEEWLTKNKVSSFVVLDDGDDMRHLTPNHIKTDLENGLLNYHVNQAVYILGRPIKSL